MPERVVRALALGLGLGLALAGCGGDGPPPIRAGMSCDLCGMSIGALGFACERRADRGFRRFDSIECLLTDAPVDPGRQAFLADYDTRALHAADSMWVVRGNFPSPMGGGYAAFLERRAASDIAERTGGRVGRLAEFAPGAGAP